METGSLKTSTSRVFRSFSLWVVLGLIAGCFSAGVLFPVPRIGVISISGTIGRDAMVAEIRQMIEFARESRAVRAVVLEIDSPGGVASVSEDLYRQLIDLKAVKPVVVHVQGMALSGGYHLAVASDYIYADATSLVGNIGVWVRMPPPEEPSEILIPTGPFKESGVSARRALGWLQLVKDAFLQSVMLTRSERLAISEEELSRAEVYLGVEALEKGLIDELGSTNDAIAKAAYQAGLRNYRVIELRHELDLRPAWYWSSYTPAEGISPDNPAPSLPKLYYQYVVEQPRP